MKYLFLVIGLFLTLNSFIQFIACIANNFDAGRMALSLIFLIVGLPTFLISLFLIKIWKKQL